jgi:hypothetical protein
MVLHHRLLAAGALPRRSPLADLRVTLHLAATSTETGTAETLVVVVVAETLVQETVNGETASTYPGLPTLTLSVIFSVLPTIP